MFLAQRKNITENCLKLVLKFSSRKRKEPQKLFLKLTVQSHFLFQMLPMCVGGSE